MLSLCPRPETAPDKPPDRQQTNQPNWLASGRSLSSPSASPTYASCLEASPGRPSPSSRRLRAPPSSLVFPLALLPAFLRPRQPCEDGVALLRRTTLHRDQSVPRHPSPRPPELLIPFSDHEASSSPSLTTSPALYRLLTSASARRRSFHSLTFDLTN